jgi:hypothetical protein
MFAIGCLLMMLSIVVLLLVVLYSRSVEKDRAALIQQRDSLWMLLDNIDTLDDICRDDDARFRSAVRKIQQCRHDILDGNQVSDEVSKWFDHSNEALIAK